MYVSAISEDGQATTVDLTEVRVVPTCPLALLGNHARALNVFLHASSTEQSVEFNGVKVPARYNDNLLLETEVVVHSTTPPPLPEDGSTIATAFNKYITRMNEDTTSHTGRTTTNRNVTEYCGGIGHAASSWPSGFETRAYCDIDKNARQVFSHNHPEVPVNTSLHHAMIDPEFTKRANTMKHSPVWATVQRHNSR